VRVAPRVGIVLGSGLGRLADAVEDAVVVPYGDVPHFPVSTVQGHSGQLVVGMLEGAPVAVMRGRVHYYEGYDLRQVTFPIRVLRRLGAEVLILTNAAGGVHEGYQPGELMVLRDHINLMGLAGLNPLIGPEDPELGVRFLDMADAYDAELRDRALRVGAELGLTVHEGVYAVVAGPSFETGAEVSFLRLAGADAVGMSTAPEVIVARHERMRVLAISVITNVAAALPADGGAGHADVVSVAERAAPGLEAIIRGVIRGLTGGTVGTL